MATRIHTNSPLPAPAMHATHALPQSKSHVLAGVQDAYWSDDEAVRTSPTAQLASVCAEYLMFSDGHAGGRGMPALSRGDGHLRSQLQAVPLRLPGATPGLRELVGCPLLTLDPPLQVCQFCWHHIKENLNSRCPACRREYTDDAVQFKPINPEE